MGSYHDPTAMKQTREARQQNLYFRSAAALTACLGAVAVLGAGYLLSEMHLPDPAVADRQDLLKWLVLRDLRTETPEIRRSLVERLQKEMKGDLELSARSGGLDAGRKDRVWSNILVLAETWYSRTVDCYSGAPPSERTACLDRAIDEILQWKDITSIQPGEPSAQDPTDRGASALKLFTQRVNIWKENASPQRRREIEDFDTALRARWLLRILGIAPTARDSRARSPRQTVTSAYSGLQAPPPG